MSRLAVTELTVRRASAGDVDLLDRHLPPPATEPAEAHSLRLEQQADGRITYLVAFDGPVPAGHVYVRWSGFSSPALRDRHPGVPLVRSLLVSPSCRRRGVGTRLMAAAEDECRAAGHHDVGLALEEGNDAAHRLYRHLGFHDDGHGVFEKTETYPEPSPESGRYVQRLVVMTKSLIR